LRRVDALPQNRRMFGPYVRKSIVILGVSIGFAVGCSEGTGLDDTGDFCEYGEGQMCGCPGGGGSVAWCLPDETAFGPCECEGGDEGFADEVGESSTSEGEGDTTGEDDDATDESTGESDTDGSETSEAETTGEETTGDGDADADEVCYPGPANDWSVCFPVVMPNLPAGYEYPGAYQGNVNYRAPIRYLDLEAIDAFATIAPNFTLDEFAQGYKGRYAVVQPHAVERIQQLRDTLGPLIVTSGYRSPTYNAMIGGATYSRHMYGDAFDLDPADVSLATLEAACTANDGFLVEYEAHVHCDWRGLPVEVAFFGLANVEPAWQLDIALASELVHADGEWRAPAQGFEEGEPARRWSAWDAEGNLLLEARGRSFVPPEGAARIEVVVGARLHRSVEL
jgi:hypothetical protein